MALHDPHLAGPLHGVEGTDTSSSAATNRAENSALAAIPAAAAPAIILVGPQLGENIGAAARAMANFGLEDLRLVAPRDGWPNERARASASGADHIIDGARVFETVEEAVGDLNCVIATTRRPRDMMKEVAGPEEGLARLVRLTASGAAAGILFGRERWGLENAEIALAHLIVTFPVDPSFASLNLAQSVLLMAYEWRRQVGAAAHSLSEFTRQPPAESRDVIGLWRHLVRALEPSGYFRPPEMRETMERNLLLVLQDAGWNTAQVRALRGVLAHLEGAAAPIRNP